MLLFMGPVIIWICSKKKVYGKKCSDMHMGAYFQNDKIHKDVRGVKRGENDITDTHGDIIFVLFFLGSCDST